MWSESLLPGRYSYHEQEPESQLDAAIAAFAKGDPVLIHDASKRENEIDIVYPAFAVTPSDVARLRNDAGGLICVALSHEVAEAFDLPFVHETVTHPASKGIDLPYDERSSFSLTVNHRDTYTGITDNDRALTISRLGEMADAPDGDEFVNEFHIPGHVNLLKAAPGLLEDREGHTELGIVLAEMAGVSPAVVVCEMLDDTTGGARSRSNASAYAEENGFVFLDESTIREAAIKE